MKSNNVYVIDTQRKQVIASIQVESLPMDLSFDSAGEKLFVANSGSTIMTVISPKTASVIQKLNVGNFAVSIAPEGLGIPRVFVGHRTPARISVFDFGMNVTTNYIDAGGYPRNLAIDPRGSVYAVGSDSDSVSVVDQFSKRVKKKIQVGKKPYGIALIR